MLDALTFIKEKIFCGKKRKRINVNDISYDMKDQKNYKKRKIIQNEELENFKILITNGIIQSGPIILNLIDSNNALTTDYSDKENYKNLEFHSKNDLSASELELFDNLLNFSKKKEDLDNYPIINKTKFLKYTV